MSQCWIFDIDGTIADNRHRTPWVQNKPKNWKAYNVAMLDDKPIWPVINVLKSLSEKYSIVLCSGRDSSNKEVTVNWLHVHGIPYTELFMRPEGDYRGDEIVKEELLNLILDKEYYPLGVFDDRRKVCEMWVRRGLHLFDVSQLREPF